jgi:hypothetical protein
MLYRATGLCRRGAAPMVRVWLAACSPLDRGGLSHAAGAEGRRREVEDNAAARAETPSRRMRARIGRSRFVLARRFVGCRSRRTVHGAEKRTLPLHPIWKRSWTGASARSPARKRRGCGRRSTAQRIEAETSRDRLIEIAAARARRGGRSTEVALDRDGRRLFTERRLKRSRLPDVAGSTRKRGPLARKRQG